MTFKELSETYCERQDQTVDGLYHILKTQKQKFNPDGWILLECQMMDSSQMGNLTILPYGPRNTHKTIPNHPISPRGLASDMSVVIGVLVGTEI